MELDTGASLSIISETTYSSLSHTLPQLSQSKVTLSTYTGEKITPLGSVDVQVQYQGQEMVQACLVVTGWTPGSGTFSYRCNRKKWNFFE